MTFLGLLVIVIVHLIFRTLNFSFPESGALESSIGFSIGRIFTQSSLISSQISLFQICLDDMRVYEIIRNSYLIQYLAKIEIDAVAGIQLIGLSVVNQVFSSLNSIKFNDFCRSLWSFVRPRLVYFIFLK